MALPANYVQSYGQIPEFFETISKGQAPDQFTMQHLKDLGFTSSNNRALIPLMKTLGFLSSEGVPTQRYHDYRDESRARQIMGDALKEAYSDLFTIRAKPTDADRSLIEGKFKSAHNTTERMAKLMANTFYALLGLGDLDRKSGSMPMSEPAKADPSVDVTLPPEVKVGVPRKAPASDTHSLHYNIQIHLPATKDIEVFNAIFRSLREHLLD